MLRLFVLLLLFLAQFVSANKAKFDYTERGSQVCAGVYSHQDWGGSLNPHIAIQLNTYDDQKFDSKDKDAQAGDDTPAFTTPVSYVIFEIKDISKIGYTMSDGDVKYICDDYAINVLKACNATQKGKFIVQGDLPPNSTILTNTMSHLGKQNISYNISKTGYYCVSTFILSDKKYSGLINFQNAFGHLSGSEIPKLPAYGFLTLLYVIALALYGFQFFKNRNKNQILPLQRYLLAMMAFLTFDSLVVWSYYDLVNATLNPSSGFVTFYMIMLSVLNAAKIGFSFFLLLCISLGYGVVVLKLKKSIMFKCKLLAGFHFLAALCYLILTYYTGSSTATSSATVNSSNFGGLLFILPLIPITITLTIYYLAILISIRKTTANLHAQRQIIKLKLYENLFRVISFSIVFTAGGLGFSSFIYLGMSSTDSIEHYWKFAYFLYEFWPSVIFFLVFMGIGYLWRPTETSYMLAISQQLSNQADDEGEEGATGYHQQGTEFELDDLSLLSHSDNEGNNHGEIDDSFELEREPTTGTSTTLPPNYEELDDKTKKSSVDEKKKNKDKTEDTEGNNTLFELGEESD